MSVSAIIVTRGDVSLKPVMASLPEEWEKIVWCNGTGAYRWIEDIAGDEPTWQPFVISRSDLSVYGRYAAIEYASHDLIYVQDDDVIVSDPQKIVNYYIDETEIAGECVVCNMPREFRHDFYEHHALVGFGAAFHREAPERAFRLFFGEDTWPNMGPNWAAVSGPGDGVLREHFNRTCDIVFTGLTPMVLVDVPKENLPHAYDDTRMWRQSTHQEERKTMLDLVLKIKETP